MRVKMKRFLGILLSLALVLGLMPGMSLTAYAAPTETLLTTITATGVEQASYSTANVATVSFSYTAEGSSSYLANWGWWGYGWKATVAAVNDEYTITKCVFYDDANRTATDSSSPFVVETTEEDKTPKVNGTPILADTSKGIKKIEVYGYAPSSDPEPESSYTITIPATLTVANSGWNATDGISATGTLESGKKLTVTASSPNNYALKSGDNSVNYTLATASTDTTATTSWEFDSLSSTATTKTMGIIVEDYSSKPAGTYTDTVTFTAAVENAGIPVSSVTINNAPASAILYGGTGTLTATVSPNEATDKTVTWSSSDSNIVSINETTGAYEIKGYGSATITVVAGDKTDTCTITGTVTYTSLQVGDVIHVGDTVYSTSSIYCNYNGTNSTMVFSNLGVYKLIIDGGNYKWQTSSGSKINIKISNTNSSNGIKVASGSGTSSSNRMTFTAN